MNGPRTKSLTVSWDHSPSGTATGYKVYVTTVNAAVQYTFDAGPETQLKAYLPIGESYYFIVVAYNGGGQSPPPRSFQVDLF